MRTIILAVIIALATAACSAEQEPPAREFPTPDISATVAAIVAQTQSAPRAADTPSQPSPPTEPTVPYSDLNLPTPTIPAWMDRLNAGGPPRRPSQRDPDAPTDPYLAILVTLPIEKRDTTTGYLREDWGEWTDDDGDCQNTRAEILIERSKAPVTFRKGGQCVVDSGEWHDPWSGQTFHLASQLDIDHHVPLAHAHVSGGRHWPPDRKSEFANDTRIPGALNPTLNTLNRQKGAEPPDKWRPPDRSSWCAYAQNWIDVKRKWELTITPKELSALTEMLDTCRS